MIWRATKYEGYFVNEDGEVKLWSGKITRGSVHRGPDGRDKGGYLRITIRRTYETPNIHRLVCEAFHGPPPTPRHQSVRKLAAWAGVSEHAVKCVVRQYTWIEPGMQRFYRGR